MMLTESEEERQKVISHITNYLIGLNKARLDEQWLWIQKTSNQRGIWISYIVEHHLDPKVPTDKYPPRRELEHLPNAALEKMAEEIGAVVDGLNKE